MPQKKNYDLFEIMRANGKARNLFSGDFVNYPIWRLNA